MLNLSKEERKQLRQAILSAYRSYPVLKIFVHDHFAFNLNEVAGSTALMLATDELIEYLDSEGDLDNLIIALQQEKPRNPQVKALFQRVKSFLQQQIILGEQGGDSGDLPFEWKEPLDDLELEAFLPQRLSYDADVGQLRRGLKLADSVCKITFSDHNRTGTGVLVAPDLILTNYHVLSSKEISDQARLNELAKSMLFEFGFISQEQDTPVRPDELSPHSNQPVVAYSLTRELDYALLRVEPNITELDYIQPVPLISVLPEKKTSLNLLHHPAGNVMQISLSPSGVVKTDSQSGRIWYVNRTQGGSSGSPCFSEKWEFVALHHASMSRGFGSIREGILFECIYAEIAEFLK